MHDTSARSAYRKIEQQLSGIVSGSDDDVRIQVLNLPLEVLADVRLHGDGVNLYGMQVEADDALIVDARIYAAIPQIRQQLSRIGFTESFYARDRPDLVSFGG